MIGAMVRAVTESVVVSQSQVAFDRTPDALLWVSEPGYLNCESACGLEEGLCWPKPPHPANRDIAQLARGDVRPRARRLPAAANEWPVMLAELLV